MKYNLDGIFNIVLYVITSIIVVIILIIQISPIVGDKVEQIKEKVPNIKINNLESELNNYVKNKSDYYYPLDGSVYCTPVKELIDNGVIKKDEIDPDKIDSTVQVSYVVDHFEFEYSDNCIEK